MDTGVAPSRRVTDRQVLSRRRLKKLQYFEWFYDEKGSWQGLLGQSHVILDETIRRRMGRARCLWHAALWFPSLRNYPVPIIPSRGKECRLPSDLRSCTRSGWTYVCRIQPEKKRPSCARWSRYGGWLVCSCIDCLCMVAFILNYIWCPSIRCTWAALSCPLVIERGWEFLRVRKSAVLKQHQVNIMISKDPSARSIKLNPYR